MSTEMGELQFQKKILKKCLKNDSQVIFLSHKKIKILKNILSYSFLTRFNICKKVLQNLKSLELFNGLLNGIPSEEANKNILWRQKNIEELGLLWFCPVLNVKKDELSKFLSIAKPRFKKYCFELPITLTLIDHKKMVAVLNISFNKLIESEKIRAYSLYSELKTSLIAEGFNPYRSGIQDAGTIIYSQDKQNLFNLLKKSLDPNNIISPGRYGIGK